MNAHVKVEEAKKCKMKILVAVLVVMQISIIPYSAKFWRGKTLVNLVNRISFANILPNQIYFFFVKLSTSG